MNTYFCQKHRQNKFNQFLDAWHNQITAKSHATGNVLWGPQITLSSNVPQVTSASGTMLKNLNLDHDVRAFTSRKPREGNVRLVNRLTPSGNSLFIPSIFRELDDLWNSHFKYYVPMGQANWNRENSVTTCTRFTSGPEAACEIDVLTQTVKRMQNKWIEMKASIIYLRLEHVKHG